MCPLFLEAFVIEESCMVLSLVYERKLHYKWDNHGKCLLGIITNPTLVLSMGRNL